MTILSAAFVCALAVALFGDRSQAGVRCSSPVNRTVEFSVTSYRDTNGQCRATVDMEHDDGDRANPWKVDIEHNTVVYPYSPSFKITVKLKHVAPPITPSSGNEQLQGPSNEQLQGPGTERLQGLGYELRQGVGYYKFHTDKKTWLEAKAVCASEGAHLAILNSENEAQILKELFNRFPENLVGAWALVGFHDIYNEGEFLTVFDKPIATTGFLRWSDSVQPDNVGGSRSNPGEDCGSIHRSNGYLNDIHCLTPYPYFCEAAL